jgi:glutathione peroxidase
MEPTIYSQSFLTSAGKEVSLADYKGKVLLLVNTATKCGLAPQFTELEDLHQKYKDRGLVVIGFPCDQFAGQEPESNESMVEVCRVHFGVTFLLSEKIDVNGSHAHPLFHYLKDHTKTILGSGIKWNFTKFLVNRDGSEIKRYEPTTAPSALQEVIEEFLSVKAESQGE